MYRHVNGPRWFAFLKAINQYGFSYVDCGAREQVTTGDDEGDDDDDGGNFECLQRELRRTQQKKEGKSEVIQPCKW